MPYGIAFFLILLKRNPFSRVLNKEFFSFAGIYSELIYNNTIMIRCSLNMLFPEECFPDIHIFFACLLFGRDAYAPKQYMPNLLNTSERALLPYMILYH